MTGPVFVLRLADGRYVGRGRTRTASLERARRYSERAAALEARLYAAAGAEVVPFGGAR